MSEAQVYQTQADVDSKHEVQPASEGSGPLLQRDYIAKITSTTMTPEQVMQLLLEDFPRFAPDVLARFEHPHEGQHPLQVGDEMQVDIPGTGHHKVVVVHLSPRSLTLRTIEGHPEAGRITFACYDEAGMLTFHIRSRARINNTIRLIGYWLMGKKAQTHIWTTFINNLVTTVGGALLEDVIVETQEVEETAADVGLMDTPTLQT